MKAFATLALASAAAAHASAYELDTKALGLHGYEAALEGIYRSWLKPEHITDSLDTFPTLTLAGELSLVDIFLSLFLN